MMWLHLTSVTLKIQCQGHSDFESIYLLKEQLGHMLLLSIYRKPYMGSPMTLLPWSLVLDLNIYNCKPTHLTPLLEGYSALESMVLGPGAWFRGVLGKGGGDPPLGKFWVWVCSFDNPTFIMFAGEVRFKLKQAIFFLILRGGRIKT